MDNVSWNVERVADQLCGTPTSFQLEQCENMLREAVKLNRRYAKWIVIEA